MTQQKLETFTVERAVAVINTAKHHKLYPHPIPEDDQKKIEEAEKLYKMAEQVDVIAKTSGKEKIGHYDAAMAVLAQAEVFGGANGDFIPPGPEAQAVAAPPAPAPEEVIAASIAGSPVVNALIGGTQKAWSLQEACAQLLTGAAFQIIDAPSLQLLRDALHISDLPSHGQLPPAAPATPKIPLDQQVAVTVDGIDDVWAWDFLVDWVVDNGNTNVVVNDEDRAAKLNEMIIAKANSPQPGPAAQQIDQQEQHAELVKSRVPDSSATNSSDVPKKDEHWVDASNNVYKINIAGGTAGEVCHLKADGSYDSPFVLPWSMFTRRAEAHEIPGGTPSVPQPESSASPSAGSPASPSSGTPITASVAASSPTPPATTSTPLTATTPQPAPSPSSPVPSEPQASGSSQPDQGATPSTPIAQPPPASPSPPTATPVPASAPSPTPPPAPAVPTSPASVPSSVVVSSPTESQGSGGPRKDPALDDDEGNEQYGKIIDKAYDKLQQRAGTPLPGEPLEPPQMPDDPTAVDSLTNRRLHLAFNACAAWVHRLIGIHNQVSIDCGRYRDSIYRAHRDEARADIGKQATVTEQNDWIILKNFDDVRDWIRRQEHHADQERSLRVLYSIYTENVSVLSRDYSMQSKDEAGSR